MQISGVPASRWKPLDASQARVSGHQHTSTSRPPKPLRFGVSATSILLLLLATRKGELGFLGLWAAIRWKLYEANFLTSRYQKLATVDKKRQFLDQLAQSAGYQTNHLLRAWHLYQLNDLPHPSNSTVQGKLRGNLNGLRDVHPDVAKMALMGIRLLREAPKIDRTVKDALTTLESTYLQQEGLPAWHLRLRLPGQASRSRRNFSEAFLEAEQNLISQLEKIDAKKGRRT